MTILFVDLETSDLLKRQLPLDDPAQPWAVSIAAELCEIDGAPTDWFHARIRADGRKIREGASRVHGMLSRDAAKSGVPQVSAIGMLVHLAAQAKYVVAFSAQFDRDVITSLLMRMGKDTSLWTRPGLEFICVMLGATQVCKLPHDPPREDGSHKWPNLDEACEIVLGEPRCEGSHDAWSDCQRAKRLFFKLLDRNVVEVAP